jgi:hypothetical protein
MAAPEDAIEKKLKEITGASISQIRAAAIGNPLRDALTRERANAPSQLTQVNAPPRPEIQSTEQTMSSKPLSREQTSSQSSSGTGVVVTGNLNGAPATMTVSALSDPVPI